MIKFCVNALEITLLSSIVLLMATSTQAKPILYDFQVQVTEGALQGKTFEGFFRYDDETLTGEGIETLGVDQGLTVCMNFLQKIYTQTDDSNYPEFPKIVFNNGEIEKLDFWIEQGKRLVWWNLPGWEVSARQREATDTNTQCEPLL